METLEKSRRFIFQNARPLDLARWNYLFEGGSKLEVIRYLSAYQNPDGGFAHALEPDCWNQQSTPIEAWAASRILHEIDFEDRTHPLVKGILKYLASGAAFDGHHWAGLNAVPSNDQFPHAPWWAYTKEKECGYNPTASLAGFILKFADKNTSVYDIACTLVKEAYRFLTQNSPLESMHEAACFVELYAYLKESGRCECLDLAEFKILLQRQIHELICRDTECWDSDYVCKPSLFIQSKESDFYSGNEDICLFERDWIQRNQNADGTWNVTWAWNDYPEQWAISKNWWKSELILRNMAYLKAFEA